MDKETCSTCDDQGYLICGNCNAYKKQVITGSPSGQDLLFNYPGGARVGMLVVIVKNYGITQVLTSYFEPLREISK